MAFRFDKLTVKSQEAVQQAQSEAESLGHQQLQPLHLLKALLVEEQGHGSHARGAVHRTADTVR